MQIDGLNYHQWQKRNTDSFRKLSKNQQKKARQQGYYNVGWQKVQESWQILQNLAQPLSFFDAKLKKGDLLGGIRQCILESEEAIKVAQEGQDRLKLQRKKSQELTKKILNKYHPL